ncbi:FAD-binding oxidoreductase [Aromatoleum toluolicum]|uniref:Uncharacterized protein n=1 Tax=Aromatoleum toluolicum TaxID=90060 RepID=A0ABX1NCF3_9RHOO|nr:hypothetical protein [Aromatoleum toluolicum]NMF96951.1 FAD-binding oxidoreductase [Aromatoleum toluolicum]
MRKITIIGAGQAGLHLGIGLLSRGFDVTVVSNRTGRDIAAGKVMSSQSMYDMAIGYERELGLALWDGACPPIEGVHMRAGTRDGTTMIDWRSRMRASGQSVDQRIKMPVWSDVSTPAEHLTLANELIREFFPWEAPRCEKLRLTDDNGILVGRITPTVRKPVGTLPSGRQVLGMADVLVLNDPITGQGSNNAAKCVKVYLDAILEQGARPFDADWMSATFERYWDYAQWVARFTNTHLLPPPPQVLKVFAACGENPRLAARVANAFDDPKGLAPWYYDPVEADHFIDSFAVAAA